MILMNLFPYACMSRFISQHLVQIYMLNELKKKQNNKTAQQRKHLLWRKQDHNTAQISLINKVWSNWSKLAETINLPCIKIHTGMLQSKCIIFISDCLKELKGPDIQITFPWSLKSIWRLLVFSNFSAWWLEFKVFFQGFCFESLECDPWATVRM